MHLQQLMAWSSFVSIFGARMRKSFVHSRGRAGVSCVMLVSLLWAPAPVAAQSLYGSLTGLVTDQTGAALPGASVTVTQAETNLSHDVVTNGTGNYNVP